MWCRRLPLSPSSRPCEIRRWKTLRRTITSATNSPRFALRGWHRPNRSRDAKIVNSGVLWRRVRTGSRRGRPAHATGTRGSDPAAQQRGEYLVRAIGFAPGFHLSRRPAGKIAHPTPRHAARASAGGLRGPSGGAQTGIYSLATPGGWHCPAARRGNYSTPRARLRRFLRVGDRVKFSLLSRKNFRPLESRSSRVIPSATRRLRWRAGTTGQESSIE